MSMKHPVLEQTLTRRDVLRSIGKALNREAGMDGAAGEASTGLNTELVQSASSLLSSECFASPPSRAAAAADAT